VDIKPTKTTRDYRRALKEIEGLMHAKRFFRGAEKRSFHITCFRIQGASCKGPVGLPARPAKTLPKICVVQIRHATASDTKEHVTAICCADAPKWLLRSLQRQAFLKLKPEDPLAQMTH
jgi:hypothetical protein